MRLPIVAASAFVAGLLGSALGAALVVHPDWFGLSGATAASPEADAEERRRASEAAKRRAEEDRIRRQEEEARRRDEERRGEQDEARRSAEDDRRRREADAPRPSSVKVSCEHAASGLKDAFVSETDCFYVQRTFMFVLSTARDGAEPSVWANARTGASGTMRVFYTTQEADGRMCRRFEQTVTLDGRKISGVGTACYRNNTWQIAG